VFIGTGAIAFGASGNLLTVAFAFGMGAMIAIYTIGHISGAHLNPVVTLAMWLDRRLPLKTSLIYYAGQLLGAFFASLSVMMGSASDAFVSLGASSFAAETSPLTAIVFEMFLTFMLIYTVLATSQRKPLQPFMGLIVGGTLIGLILVGGPITSASLNPFRSLAPAFLTGGEALSQVWVFFLGPTLGAILAVAFYRFLKFKDQQTL
jgi:aquaporin Z